MLNNLDKEIKKVLKNLFYEKIIIIVAYLAILLTMFFIKSIFVRIIVFVFIVIYIFVSLWVNAKVNEEKQIEDIAKILKNHNIISLDNIKELMNYNKERNKKWSFITIASFGLLIFELFQNYASIEENLRIVLIIEVLMVCYIVIRGHEDFSNQHYISKLNDILFYLCINYDKYFENKKRFLNRLINKLINYSS